MRGEDPRAAAQQPPGPQTDTTPYHLFEFTRRSFDAHGHRAGYAVIDSRIVVCDTFVPRRFQRLADAVMARTGTGMILEVWLRGAG